MSETLYAASCNPPRRAKKSTLVETPSPPTSATTVPPLSPQQPRSILPMKPYAPRPATAAAEPVAPPLPPSKRGRKPGPLSRSAREAQRRLNHSIIEKARRTKINDALARLKQLVPAHYGQSKSNVGASPDDEKEEEEDDDEYDEGDRKRKPKPKGAKKEEKEKEFKLEILVRTVSFLEDLLQRVDGLDTSTPTTCHNCEAQDTRKRKRDDLAEDDGLFNPDIRKTKLFENHVSSIGNERSLSSPTATCPTDGGARLPSISSWLPNSVIDPQLLTTQRKSSSTSPRVSSYLPSPPSSTHFDPVRTSQIPPLLNLGPVATAAMVNPSRTPEDESAASLLLQISASSPTFRPVSASSAQAYGLPDPSIFLLHNQQEGSVQVPVRQAQTPGSLLGLNHKITERNY